MYEALILYVKHYDKAFTGQNLIQPSVDPMGRFYYWPHFMDGEIEVLKC